MNFSSGYIQRALAHQPKQGSKRPWKLYQNYALDLLSLRFGPCATGRWCFRARSASGGQQTRSRLEPRRQLLISGRNAEVRRSGPWARHEMPF